ncbi:MAG: ABC transporter ATP-binding protein [Planctomycetota bacterium]
MNNSKNIVPAAQDSPPVSNGKSAVVLRAENLQRFFIDGVRRLDVLKGVNLSLSAGEVTVLVGRSGSGKSTLLHLLGLLDRPNGGETLIDGTPAGSLSENDRSYLRNQYIGFVFQHYFLLPEFNALENVLLPAKSACSVNGWLAKKSFYRARADELLDLVGLSAQARQRPATLSGGEQQRVALARALILQPKILLCDEPTGNLDPDTGALIMDLIFKVSHKHGAAALVASHDQTLAGRANSIMRLEQGMLKAEYAADSR